MFDPLPWVEDANAFNAEVPAILFEVVDLARRLRGWNPGSTPVIRDGSVMGDYGQSNDRDDDFLVMTQHY